MVVFIITLFVYNSRAESLQCKYVSGDEFREVPSRYYVLECNIQHHFAWNA